MQIEKETAVDIKAQKQKDREQERLRKEKRVLKDRAKQVTF